MAKRQPWRVREVLIHDLETDTYTDVKDMTEEERFQAWRKINDRAMSDAGYYRIGSEEDPDVQKRA